MGERKVCFRCGGVKELSEFYAHPGMSDGHLNKCKECARADTMARLTLKQQDPEFIKNEKKRHRDKYFRLYRFIKCQPDLKRVYMKKYRQKYPEKYQSQITSQRIPTIDGYHKHHWSYAKENQMSVIILTLLEHAKLHRYSTYDQKRMMYRTFNGVLLDSKGRAEAYLKTIQNLD